MVLTSYCRYDALKKYIYQLEKQQNTLDRSYTRDLESNEHSSLMGRGGDTGSDAVFVSFLDKELKKITLFYEHQEKELMDEVTELEEQAIQQEEAGLAAGMYYEDGFEGDDDDDDDDEDEDDFGGLHASQSRERDRSGAPRRRRRTSTTSGRGRNRAGPGE